MKYIEDYYTLTMVQENENDREYLREKLPHLVGGYSVSCAIAHCSLCGAEHVPAMQKHTCSRDQQARFQAQLWGPDALRRQEKWRRVRDAERRYTFEG